MHTPILIKSFTAKNAITAHHIVKVDEQENSIAMASGHEDPVIGVCDVLSAKNDEAVDVIVAGTADVMYGGKITKGAVLISNNNGKAIPLTSKPASGKVVRILGTALTNGGENDIGTVLLATAPIYS